MHLIYMTWFSGMQIENSTLIPNDNEAVWRVDNKWMLDLNEWMESSIPITLSDDTHARFNYRYP
ncbi:unnamed protein product [Brassica oleracea var. botrytis]